MKPTESTKGMIFLCKDDVTALVIDQTFQLPQPIDTLVSVNVEPSQLIETKEGLRGTLDLMIYYEPCEERENEADITQDALLITEVRASEMNEVCAYFSFPIELYGVSEETHLAVSELDYVLPTRSTFTLKANVQVFQPSVRHDEHDMALPDVTPTVHDDETIELETVKEETNLDTDKERAMDEDVKVYTPKKQLDESGEKRELEENIVDPSIDEPIRQGSQDEEQVNNTVNAIVETDLEKEEVSQAETAARTDQSDPSCHAREMTPLNELKEEQATEEEDRVTEEIIDKSDRVIYQHYGLKSLDNPHVKLPCVIIKEDTSLSEWCHERGLEMTRLKRVNTHVEETIQAGQVLILPDGGSST